MTFEEEERGGGYKGGGVTSIRMGLGRRGSWAEVFGGERP